MTTTWSKAKGNWQDVLAGVFLVLFFFLQVNLIFKESRVFDEHLFINAGYQFLTKKDFTADPYNPPLAREITSFPLLFNINLINDPFLFWPRLMVVFFSLGLSFLLYKWSSKLWGKKAGLISLILLLLTPEILAHSHLVLTDLLTAFFLFLTYFLFDKYFIQKKNPGKKEKVIFFISLGFSLAVRTVNLFLLAPLFIYYFFFLRKEKLLTVKDFALGVVLVITVIWSTYFFTLEPVLGYRTDPNREAFSFIKAHPGLSFLLEKPIPLGSYISTYKSNYIFLKTDKLPKYAAFMGKEIGRGPGYFTLLVFLLKTPIPLLIIFGYPLLKKEKNETEKFLKTTSLLILSEILFLGTDIRIRYFLCLYPLFTILGGRTIVDFNNKTRTKTLLTGLIVWLAISTFSSYPHFLTYFNEIVGKENGYKIVVDSNLDWGQGLPSLKKYLENNNIKDYQLAYFGSANPEDYGLSYERIKDFNPQETKEIKELDLSRPIVISASCWYFCGYYKNEELKTKTPKVIEGQYLLFN